MSKRKKQPTVFKADNIDNTASVKKLIEELHEKNVLAHSFYSRTVKQRHTTKQSLHNYHCAVLNHPLNAFSDDWDGELNTDYFEPFPYKSLPPRIITSVKNIGINDPVAEYMKCKMEWQQTLRSFRKSASYSNMKENYENLNEEVVRCPKHFVDMAAHIDRDPDPYFDSGYNWYYAGNGNLQLVSVDWVDYLLHSVLNVVYLSQLDRSDMSVKSEHCAEFKCESDNNILETICSSENIVVLRTKAKIYILKIITSNDEIKFSREKVIKSDIPYTSIAFDNYHKNILYITTLDNRLSIVNLDRMRARNVKLNEKLTSLTDNWNTVIGSGRQFYTHATKHSISIYDKRSNSVSYIWNSVRNITDEIACNDITVAKHFEGSTSLYFGTDHHLFLMDLRFLQNLKPRVVQRWTHGMESPPTYLSYCNMEFSKNLICLSSQWCEDLCVVPNYNDRIIENPDAGGVTIPYRPPSILGALNEARQKMLCFDLYNPVDDRLCTAITGNLVIEQGEKYDILMQNSLGDITCHTLFPQHLEMFIEDDSAQKLDEWCSHYKIEDKVFEVSSIENIASILKQLKKVNANYKVEGTWVKKTTQFNEKEIAEAFENEVVDSGLQDAWNEEANINDANENRSSLALKLYFSEGEESDN